MLDLAPSISICRPYTAAAEGTPLEHRVRPLLRRSNTHTVFMSTSKAVMVLRRCGRETVSYGDFDQLLDIRLIGSDFAIDFLEHAGGTES